MTEQNFKPLVDSVRQAISKDIHPRMITKGSSGSYFAVNVSQDVVGVFKPKDEEPYGKLNPKWTKWVHRNLFPCFFGRGCLIPNLSYISEAGASLLDRRLQLNMVPHTEVVHLSSKSFFYDYLDRRAARKKQQPLPEKIGSFQTFMKGFKDASDFLRDNPWPDRFQRSYWGSYMHVDEPDLDDEQRHGANTTEFAWTRQLKQQFIDQLQKLVVLDYLMRNTDRGLDNWMIKFCPGVQENDLAKASVLKQPTTQNPLVDLGDGNTSDRESGPHLHIAAIDNSLSFPFKHPDSWRSFTYGWLFLPESLIGQPWTEANRKHFLPLLSSPDWWRETINQLRQLFMMDADFNERMFSRQMAVMKGQGYNLVESLKVKGDGPVDLIQMPKILVVEDEVEVADLAFGTDEQQPNSNQVSPASVRVNSWAYGSRGHRSLSVDGSRPDLSKLMRSPMATRPGASHRQVSDAGVSMSRSVGMLESMEEGRAEEEITTSRQNWAAKIRDRLSLDAGSMRRPSGASTSDQMPTKIMLVERIESVTANPAFTCC